MDKKADYLISLKGNQGQLNEDVRLFFEKTPKEALLSTETKSEKGHGRIEIRQCTVSADIAWLRERHPHWKKLESVIEIKSQREIKGEVTTENRYTSAVYSANRENFECCTATLGS